MRRNEGIVVSREKEHIAVLHVEVGLFHIDSKRQVDEREVSDQDVILQIKSPQRGHISVGVVSCEILYGETGLQGCSLFEDRLRIAHFQPALEGGKMDDLFVVDEIHTEKAFKLESPQGVGEAGIDLADVHDAVVLRGPGFGVEIDEVVDGGVPEACVDKAVLAIQFRGQVGGGVEVVVPAEMVGIVSCLEPGGGLAFHVDVERQDKIFPEAVFVFPEALFPLPSEVEIA